MNTTLRIQTSGRSRLLAPAITVAVLIVVSAVVGLGAGKGLLLRPELLLLGLGALMALVAMLSLEVGILGLLLTAAVVPYSLPTGTQSRIAASMVVAALLVAVWLAGMLARKHLSLKPASTNVPLFGFVAAYSVSLVWSNAFRPFDVNVWATFPLVQIADVVKIVLFAGSFVMVSNVLTDLKRVKLLWLLVVILGGIAIPLELLGIRPAALNTGGLFPMWVVSLAYGQVLFNSRLAWWQRLLLVLLVGSWVYRVFLLGVTWISGWLPTLIVVLSLSFLKSKRLFVLLILLLLAHVALDYDFYYGRIWTHSIHEDAGRLALWRRNWEVTSQHLLFGTGPAGYAVYYMTYFPEEAMSSHSNYVDIISQTGIVGSFFFAWFLASLMRTGLTTMGRLRQWTFQNGLNRSLVCGLLGVLGAMFLGDWLVPFVYNQGLTGFNHAIYSWLLLGAMVALYHTTGQTPQPLAGGGYNAARER